MSKDIDNKIIQSQYVEQMQTLAKLIDELFNGELKRENRITGFCLLVFPFGEHVNARVNYISNTNQEDMIKAMKEFIAIAEGKFNED